MISEIDFKKEKFYSAIETFLMMFEKKLHFQFQLSLKRNYFLKIETEFDL
jgi:hypothetical protein